MSESLHPSPMLLGQCHSPHKEAEIGLAVMLEELTIVAPWAHPAGTMLGLLDLYISYAPKSSRKRLLSIPW